jgi:DNA polymerase-4
VRLDDFSTVTRAHTLAERTCEVELVTEVALRLLEEYSPSRPVRLLGVRVAGLSSAQALPADLDSSSESGTMMGMAQAADQLALPM